MTKEQGELIKNALKIVEELGKYDFEDTDELISIEDELRKLIKKAKQLKKNPLWKLN